MCLLANFGHRVKIVGKGIDKWCNRGYNFNYDRERSKRPQEPARNDTTGTSRQDRRWQGYCSSLGDRAKKAQPVSPPTVSEVCEMKIKRLCAWCGKDMGEKPPLEDKSETHGMCEECFSKFRTNPRKSRLLAGAAIHHRANNKYQAVDEVAPAGYLRSRIWK